MISITRSAIDIGQVIRAISTPRAGGIDVFVGTVRDHSRGRKVRHIEYSAYVPMAEKLMREIEEEIVRQWAVERVILSHRIGLLQIGDIAVVTAVSSSHRAEAFEACRYAIDRVKTVVPIWKKEHFEDGLAWVIGQHQVDVGETK